MTEHMYTTRQVMEMFGIKSRQTLYARGWAERAVRAFPDSDEPGPLMWPQSLVDTLAAEQGVTL